MLHLLSFLRVNSVLMAINSTFGTQTKQNKRKIKENIKENGGGDAHAHVYARETPPPPPPKIFGIDFFFF